MNRFSTVTYLGFGLVAITLSILALAQLVGIYPDPTQEIVDGRLRLSEVVGMQCAAAVRGEVDFGSLEVLISSLVERNAQVLSVGVRKADGELVIQSRDHDVCWVGSLEHQSTPTHIRVPIVRGAQPWGVAEISFEPLYGGYWHLYRHPVLGMMLFMGVMGFCLYRFYLRRALKLLNPQSVIPEHIQVMFDTMTEGVVILDKKEQILLANKAFADNIGGTSKELQGTRLSKLKWESTSNEDKALEFPWIRALQKSQTQMNVPLKISVPSSGSRAMMVNASPMTGVDGKVRGALVTFDDITSVEQKNLHLNDLVSKLRSSGDQIRQQNEQLEKLAKRDPLTNCFNRRSLFELFETLWRVGEDNQKDIGCIMCDIDHFKSINDNHGHSVGDEVLKGVSQVFLSLAGEMDLVCRYGGEEFCILVRNGGIDQAQILAEKFRQAIAEQVFGEISVTCSFGVSSKNCGAASPQELLDQADQALYAAKNGGRNQVIPWNMMPSDLPQAADERPRTTRSSDAEPDIVIPFQAVMGLLEALTQRDAITGQHSKRVADLCAMVCKDMTSARDGIVLEIAALMHDIGKLGVPDAILMKPGQLCDEEWRVMRLHDEMGVAIINATFASKELTEIIRTHHAWYTGNPSRPKLPVGEEIPYLARILSVADAFDAMVSDRPYRKGITQEEAFEELRRCAGTQFDSDIVQRFIDIVGESHYTERLKSTDLTQHFALQLGRAVENLTKLHQEGDMASLSIILNQLKRSAEQGGAKNIVELTSQLEKTADDDVDLMELARLTHELLDLCQVDLYNPGGQNKEQNAEDVEASRPGKEE